MPPCTLLELSYLANPILNVALLTETGVKESTRSVAACLAMAERVLVIVSTADKLPGWKLPLLKYQLSFRPL